MNASNPFQIPPCLQRDDLRQRRRQWFRNTFFAVLIGHSLLFMGLLIQGCKSQPAATTNLDRSAPQPSAQAVATPAVKSPTVTPAPVVTTSVAQPKPAPAIAAETPAAKPAKSETIYLVKSGDTLIRIAKNHGTTVQAIKSANNLSTDRLVVGAKLKIETM